MPEMSLTEARSRLADVIDEARVGHDPVFLTRRGRQVAAVIDADDLRQLLEAAEDLADIRAAQSAREEMAVSGESAVSLADLKAELGMA
ncbi:type II toxin-antitoxin system Phd/YefM family antitoxin [Nocardioides sp. W7]|uniref:type II toxin-antitoxin system Phd/YefM family antitoxin n=1 Tax=Nocardioides sp. W7 TaxID=2931390 RepID=UPI001FD07D87|nr:type II toxin-antitoxin system Phd/YefM family antitoxin [Nocardioides sp. W7]